MHRSILLDTNVLLYSKNVESKYFNSTCDAIKALALSDFNIFINRQILREYASIATKPYPRGFGITLDSVLIELSEFEDAYNLLSEPDKIWSEWKRLLIARPFTGEIIHDVYIAASMKVNEITNILTFNIKDFSKFERINPISPTNIDSLFK